MTKARFQSVATLARAWLNPGSGHVPANVAIPRRQFDTGTTQTTTCGPPLQAVFRVLAVVATFGAAWSVVPGGWAGERESRQSEDQQAIPRDTAALLRFLEDMPARVEVEKEVSRLVRQLTDPVFSNRREAFERLADFGAAARPRLVEAGAADDPELRMAARRLLPLLDARSAANEALVSEVLKLLATRRPAEAVPVLVRTLPKLDEPATRREAAQTLWACTQAGHGRLLVTAMQDGHLPTRAAVIVALELAQGADSVSRLAALLEAPQPAIRLAAARALLDRRPRAAIGCLLGLVGEDDLEISWQADALLRLKTGHTVEFAATQSLEDAWHEWADKHLAKTVLVAAVGRKRLDLTAVRGRLLENFARDKAWFDEGYGLFRYEATNGARARVAGGRLYLDGSGAEGDQRLAIHAEQMIGRVQWPRQVVVRARLGSADGNNVGRHVGVSVGRVKVLFHPGYSGGGFRAETTDTHSYLFGNEVVGFTPAADTLHEMTIEVTRTDAGADFAVVLEDGASNARYAKKFSATVEQLGPFNRIGLERSGRTGGDAWFDLVEIRLQR